MPSNSTFRPQTISEPKKHQFTIGAFRGVDYRPIQLQVKDYNATDIKNFIYRDNANQKRMGYEQLCNIPISLFSSNLYSLTCINENNSVVTTNTSSNINGLYEFLDEDNEYHLIAHIGSFLYEIKNISGAFYSISYELICEVVSPYARKAIKLNDTISSAFYNNGKLYILDGNKYICIYKGDLESSDIGIKKSDSGLCVILVENSHLAYVPTTTIGITYKDSPVTMNASLDKINLLSNFRKNKLVSGTFIEDGENARTTANFDYELDTNISGNQSELNDIEVSITNYVLQVE